MFVIFVTTFPSKRSSISLQPRFHLSHLETRQVLSSFKKKRVSWKPVSELTKPNNKFKHSRTRLEIIVRVCYIYKKMENFCRSIVCAHQVCLIFSSEKPVFKTLFDLRFSKKELCEI